MSDENQAATSRQILVIDDDLVFLELLKQILTQAGFVCHLANSGSEGIDLAREMAPDLVICDIAMEDMDGYQVLERFQSDRDLRLVPFLFLSGFANDRDRRRGMGMGANDFIMKPFEVKDLLASIDAQLRRKESFSLYIDAMLNQLKSVSDERESFLNLISHRIRSSFSGILGAIRLLEDELLEMETREVVEILQMMREDVRNNLRLSDNLLTWTRKQTSNKRYEHQSLSLFGSAENALVQLYDLAMSKGILMENQIPRHAKVLGSETDLHEIFHQLLINAIEHSKCAGAVVISAIQREDKCYQVTVADKGVGIAPELLEKLFDSQNGAKRLAANCRGFGLSIAYDLIRSHQGRLWIKCQPGQGTEVHFTLPEG